MSEYSTKMPALRATSEVSDVVLIGSWEGSTHHKHQGLAVGLGGRGGVPWEGKKVETQQHFWLINSMSSDVESPGIDHFHSPLEVQIMLQ